MTECFGISHIPGSVAQFYCLQSISSTGEEEFEDLWNEMGGQCWGVLMILMPVCRWDSVQNVVSAGESAQSGYWGTRKQEAARGSAGGSRSLEAGGAAVVSAGSIWRITGNQVSVILPFWFKKATCNCGNGGQIWGDSDQSCVLWCDEATAWHGLSFSGYRNERVP